MIFFAILPFSVFFILSTSNLIFVYTELNITPSIPIYKIFKWKPCLLIGALSYMHACIKIYHMDIKSLNIMLDENNIAIVSVTIEKTHLTTRMKGNGRYCQLYGSWILPDEVVHRQKRCPLLWHFVDRANHRKK